MAKTRRKGFNYIVGTDGVVIQKLGYGEDEQAFVAEEKTFNLADLPEQFTNGDSVLTLAASGLSQKLQDLAASFDVDEKMAQFDAGFEMLKEGLWKAARASGTGERKATIAPELAEAFAEFVLAKRNTELTIASATTVLQGMSAEERKAVREHPEIADLVKAKREAAAVAAADLDIDSLF